MSTSYHSVNFSLDVRDLYDREPRFRKFVEKCIDRFREHDWGDVDDYERDKIDAKRQDGTSELEAFYAIPDDLKEAARGQEFLMVKLLKYHTAAWIMFPYEDIGEW